MSENKKIDDMTDEEHDKAWEEALTSKKNVDNLNVFLKEIDKEISEVVNKQERD